MLQLLKLAQQIASNTVVVLDVPATTAASTAYAEALRIDHEALLTAHREIDAMDALHIVFGSRLGATAFVSFDKRGQSVGSVNVLF